MNRLPVLPPDILALIAAARVEEEGGTTDESAEQRPRRKRRLDRTTDSRILTPASSIVDPYGRPVSHSEEDFSPLDGLPINEQELGRRCVAALQREPLVQLASLKPFPGFGIYAIYYCGQPALHGFYDSDKWPLYDGKSVHRSRMGDDQDTKSKSTIYGRLKGHARSIAEVPDLCLSNFYCRYRLIGAAWVVLAENYIHSTLFPLWNVCLDGFGSNGAGRRRKETMKSAWDTVYCGRKRAKTFTPRQETREQLLEKVSDHIAYIKALNPPKPKRR